MSKSPYQMNSRQQRVDSVVESVTEFIADLIVHRIFRKKRAQLKFEVSTEKLENLKAESAEAWQNLLASRAHAKKNSDRIIYTGLALSLLMVVISIYFFVGGGLPLVLIIMFIAAYKAAKYKMAFNHDYAETLLPSLLKHLDGYDYQRNGFIPIDSVLASQIIPDHHSSLTQQEDYLYHKSDDVKIEMVECELSRWRTNSKGNRYRSSQFRGLLLKMELPHRINSRVILHANWGKFLSLMQKKPMDKELKVELNCPNPLGHRFDIYAEDPTVAKLVLTETFLQEYKAFTDKLDIACPEFSLYEDKCVLLLHRPEDMFKPPSLHGELCQEDVLIPILREIRMIEELTAIAKKASL